MTAQMEPASVAQAEAKPEAKAEQTPAATASKPTTAQKPAATPVAKATTKLKARTAAKAATKPAAKTAAKRKRKAAATRKTTKAAKPAPRKAAKPTTVRPATAKSTPPVKEFEAMFESSLKQMQDVLSEFGGGVADLPLAREEFSQVVEATRDATVTGMSEYNKELSEFTQNRMTECWEITRGMLGAKSLPEALEVQSRYMQDAMKAYADEAQKLNSIATEVTQKAFAPMTNGFADVVSKMLSGKAA